jgi:hypothetical protein
LNYFLEMIYKVENNILKRIYTSISTLQWIKEWGEQDDIAKYNGELER